MNLLQLELRKLLPYKAFWVILALFSGLFLLSFFTGRNFSINGTTMGTQLYNFPAVWQNGAWMASFFNVLLGILMIVVVTDEFTFRTLRQQVIDGLSRSQIILAKISVIILVALVCTLVVGIASFVMGNLYSANSTASAFSNLSYLGGYFLHAIAFMSLGLLVAILVKRSGLAIIVFLSYTLMEWIIRFGIDDSIDRFFPMKTLDALTPNNRLGLLMEAAGISNQSLTHEGAMAMTVVYILFFWGISYLLLKNRDL